MPKTQPASISLRHAVATLAYRGGKAIRGAPAEFANFKASPTTRTPGQILAHIGDLLDWAIALADGKHVWRDSTPLAWDREAARFFRALRRFDKCLATKKSFSPERMFQGPIADALTHVGQIALQRRMAGSPVRGENYFKAEIAAGCVGARQKPAVVEFD